MPLRAARPTARALAPRRDEARGPAAQTPASITATLQAFLEDHPDALVLEDGRTLFNLREAKYSLSSDHDRATLHLWSDDRNLVRRILSVTPRAHTLSLATQRFGQTRPQTLELTADQHLRTPTTRDSNRQRYLRLLDRVLVRAFPDLNSEGLRSAMDLERSFGPAYARGTLVRGQHAWAVIAVNPAESQATIDGILTIGILWLQHCRDQAPTAARKPRLFAGLRLILPRATAATTLSRLAWLNPRIAKYELYELDQLTEDLIQRDPSDHGNLTTRLIHAPNVPAALDRFAGAIPQVLALLPSGTHVFGLDNPTPLHPNALHPALLCGPLPHPDPAEGIATETSASQPPARQASRVLQQDWLPEPTSSGVAAPAHRNHNLASATPTCELRLRSNTELAFLLHGLEFARIRSAFAGQSFNRQLEITVGSGPSETALTAATEPHLRDLVRHLFNRRQPHPSQHLAPHAAVEPPYPGPDAIDSVPTPTSTQDPLFRTQPERWLESTLRANLPDLDPNLQPAPVYTQVPAFTGAGSSLDRGLLDLLAVTRSNRLAVIEIKTSEDLHLALQGLDYWIRVRHHHLDHPDPASGLGDLQQHGYFPRTRLSADPPHLYLVAPALHIHPATETILRHLDPRVPWTLIALDESWRTHIKPVWRRRSSDPH